MSDFLLSSVNGKKDIIKMHITKAYTLNPKNEVIKGTKLKQVTIYDENKIQEIVIRNYQKKYQRILKIIGDLTANDDATTGDYMICLDEVQKLKSILAYKYQKFLKKEMYEYFLNRLFFFEKILNDKIIEYQESMHLEGKSR